MRTKEELKAIETTRKTYLKYLTALRKKIKASNDVSFTYADLLILNDMIHLVKNGSIEGVIK